MFTAFNAFTNRNPQQSIPNIVDGGPKTISGSRSSQQLHFNARHQQGNQCL